MVNELVGLQNAVRISYDFSTIFTLLTCHGLIYSAFDSFCDLGLLIVL